MAFVGRARELEELEGALAAARAGRGQAVLVTGDAGIGKTRLATELASRAGDFDVLHGQALDLVGTELPYQPFADALGELGRGGSQLEVFETALARLSERAKPVLLILEDLHWADQSTLDLVVFVAHHVRDRRVVLLATARGGELPRLAAALRRSGRVLELAPLDHAELAALLAGRADAARIDAIIARAEGNPFFAEELLAAGEDLPVGLRELLLERVTGLDQELLRIAAAAGREVTFDLLHATAERDVRALLRAAVERGVLVPARDAFRFRHALLAEAVYATILPGEREALHARLAAELAGTAPAAELAPHWAAAGRRAEAFAASLEAAAQAEALCGLAEALSHLERAIALWDGEHDLVELCARAAELASQVGRAPRAVELAQQALDRAGTADGRRASRLHVRLGEYLYESGDAAGFAALERAVELAPPGSPERAFALGSVAGGLMMARRRTEALRTAEQALTDARAAGAGAAEVRALTVIGLTSAYLGQAEAGVARLREALRLATRIDDRWGLDRVYVNFTDVLTMLGRPAESARLGHEGLEVLRGYGIESTILLSNHVEALLATGDWEEADRLSAAALRTANFEFVPHVVRASLELGRGDFAAAREHLEAGTVAHHEPGLTDYLDCVAELALWERRWLDADAAVRDGLARARYREAPEFTLALCTKGLRAQAELAALARARHDAAALTDRLARAQSLLASVREAAAAAEPITPRATACRLQAEAEHARAAGEARPEAWADAADAWERVGYAPVAAYCRWREAEALVAAGASRAAAAVPLRAAHAVAARIGAAPLRRELELLAQRARLDLAPPPAPEPDGEPLLGLTPRETEVLSLVARGLTNREIADALVISVRTAGVHVAHILRKLDAPNRLEAAAIAHRVGLHS